MLLLQGVACVARTWQCPVVSGLFHRAQRCPCWAGTPRDGAELLLCQVLELQQ